MLLDALENRMLAFKAFMYLQLGTVTERAPRQSSVKTGSQI